MGEQGDVLVQARRDRDSRRAVLRDAIVSYARERLPRRLGLEGQTVTLRRAAFGVRSIVHLVDLSGGSHVVLRALTPWVSAARLTYNLRSFARLGLPVPRLLDSDLSPLTAWRWGFYALTEERVDGTHPHEHPDQDAAARAVARALARFHSVERWRWGWPGLPRIGSYRAHLIARAAKRARHLDKALAQPRRREIEAWFREHSRSAPLGSPFALCHSRVNPGNFLLRPDGEAVALDLIESRYGAFAIDLVSAFYRICDGEAARIAAFLDEYFAARPAWCREAFDGARTFFEANRALGQAATFTRRAARAAAAGDADELALFRAGLRDHVAYLSSLTGIDLPLEAP
jgi:Ser/Thr protein kinase RdoA (MazF antagonist)